MPGIIDLFVPREKKFFEYLNRQIEILSDCSDRLSNFFKKNNFNPRSQKLKRDFIYIQKKSDEAEILSAEIINLLQQTFITPIDREEIKSLSVSINFIVDSIEKITSSMLYFNIKKLDSYFLKQLRILQNSIGLLKLIFNQPLFLKQNRTYIEKIKTYERQADVIFRKATIGLFNNGHDPIEIIKQKELYEITEDAIDDAKHIVDLMETVLINNA